MEKVTVDTQPGNTILARVAGYRFAPFIVAFISFQVFNSITLSVVIFLVMFGMIALSHILNSKSQPQDDIDSSSQATIGTHTESTNVLADLKQKIDRLSESSSRVDSDVDAAPSENNAAPTAGHADPFDQGRNAASFDAMDSSSALDAVDSKRFDAQTATASSIIDKSERETILWLAKLKDLDERVAWGKINDEQYERQYRQIMRAYRS